MDFFLSYILQKIKFIPYLGFFPYKELLEDYHLPSFISSFANFDGVHYLILAKQGYSQYEHAFFPLYPLLIKLLTPIFFGNALLTGLIISNVSFLLGLIIFYKYLRMVFADKEARMPVFRDLGGADRAQLGSTPTEQKNMASSFLNNKPVYVKHLGRYRIQTLFPYLLEDFAKMGFDKVDFMSSNPWDFSDELIAVIARNKNITRTIHLPVQSGDDNVLKRMNRWYKASEYLALISKLKTQISNLKITTDIIVGFCGETEKEFKNTVKLCKKVGFEKAYIAMYSPRPMTAATKKMEDDVPHKIKKQRWQTLEDLINQPNLKKR